MLKEPQKEASMSAGQGFVKMIRPVGCVLFLLIFVLYLVFCFTYKRPALADYTPPHESSYYTQSSEGLAELKTELEANVFPKLDGVIRCDVNPEFLTVIIDQKDFEATRSAILKYYDENLFQFVGEEVS
ncbi:MAG: hypothetical protein RR394_09190 [Oscillospiraceae bacterium]